MGSYKNCFHLTRQIKEKRTARHSYLECDYPEITVPCHFGNYRQNKLKVRVNIVKIEPHDSPLLE